MSERNPYRGHWLCRPIGISFIVAWYDLWIGVFWDRDKRRLYILPLPCIGIVLDFGARP